MQYLCAILWLLLLPGCRGDDDGDAESGPGGSNPFGEADPDADGDDGMDIDPETGGRESFGEKHTGQYHLGPVDFAETEWHNACAPGGGYRSALRNATGLGEELLAGVATQYAQNGGACDACILIETGEGFSTVARVVTYGKTNEPGDIDVSPAVYEALDQGEWPRAMSWGFTECPDTGTLQYEFQTEANPWWTSLWVRNPKVPIDEVAVRSANHSDFFTLRRAGDGTLNDDSGFGEGAFTLRITAMDGQVIEDTLPGFSAGELIVSSKQFE